MLINANSTFCSVLTIAACYGLLISCSNDDTIVLGTYKPFRSAGLDETFSFVVDLPGSYNHSCRSFPVIYIMNRQNRLMLANAISTVRHLSSSQIPEMILVGISNSEHTVNYFPVQPNGESRNADSMFSSFCDEFIPHIDNHYRTGDLRILVGHSTVGLFTLSPCTGNLSCSMHILLSVQVSAGAVTPCWKI